MALAPGTKLGQYEVIAPIGAGGMGEVSTVDSGNRLDVSRGYDASADGNEFFAVRDVSKSDPERRLVVITDWASTQPR